MLNGSLTLNLECCSGDRRYWKSRQLFVHPDEQDNFRYRYIIKYKEGLAMRLINAITFKGNDEKAVKETKTRKLNIGTNQYDIFHNPNDRHQMKTIFHGQIFFVKRLYHMLGDQGNLKEILIECEHVGFGHPSYAMADIDSFIQWVMEIINKNPTCCQSVYICSLLGQFVRRMKALSAQYICNSLGKKAADKLLSSLGDYSFEALPQTSTNFIKDVAEYLCKAGSSTGSLLFIKVFCNLLDVDFVLQVADTLSSQTYTEQQFHQQVPSVLHSLARLKHLNSCRRFCCYIIDRSPTVQCLWNLYRAISSRLPDLVQSLVDEFSKVYCKFISHRRGKKPDLFQSSFWSQVPDQLKDKLANQFCEEFIEQISSETNWSEERLDSLTTVALDARLQSADQFLHFILTVATHKSQEVVSLIPVFLKAKVFCMYWDTSISAEDKEKVCRNWLRSNFHQTGKKPKEHLLDVLEACESLCATDALRMNKALCQAMDKAVEALLSKTTFKTIRDAYVDAQERNEAIQQRLTILLRSAIRQQSGTGDRRSKYRQMIRLLGYDDMKEKEKDLQKVKLDR